MSNETEDQNPKKHFFKVPENFSTLSDEEIDDFTRVIWEKFMDGQDLPKQG